MLKNKLIYGFQYVISILLGLSIFLSSCTDKSFNWGSNTYIIEEIKFEENVVYEGINFKAKNNEKYLTLKCIESSESFIKNKGRINELNQSQPKLLDDSGNEYLLSFAYKTIIGGEHKYNEMNKAVIHSFIFGSIPKESKGFVLEISGHKIPL